MQTINDEIIFISVVRDQKMYQHCFKDNPNCTKQKLVILDNSLENKGISTRYNEFLESYNYSHPAWLIFCHEDWKLLKDIQPVLNKRDKSKLYGTIGVMYKDSKKYRLIYSRGQIEQCRKDGSRNITLGSKPPFKGVKADTADCQCLIVHSDLIKQHNLRFDEHLTFDFYVEEFCINASENYGIPLLVIPVKTRHYSYGNVTQRFYDAVSYVRNKYPNLKHPYASTVAGTIIGVAKGKPIKNVSPFWKNFWFQKKYTNSGYLLIKICKIPIYSKRIE